MTLDTTPVVILRIGQKWLPGMDEDQVYDVVRGWWKIGARRNTVVYAAAVAHGVVRGVYEIFGWMPRGYTDDRATDHVLGPVLWGFDGQPAEQLRHLIGTDVSPLFAQGAQNPVRYSTLGTVQRLAATPAATVELVSIVEADDLHETGTSTQDTALLDLLRRTCADLERNEVLHLSLGSKEHFHSNLLAFLAQRYPSQVSEALRPWLREDLSRQVHRVRREAHQLDLVIELPGYRPVVIENKVFSLPDEHQLDRYSVDNIPAAGIAEPTLVLLSLGDPGWWGGAYGGWTWAPWSAVAERLGEAFAGALPPDAFTAQLVRRWVQLLQDLTTVIRATAPHDSSQLVRLGADELAVLGTVGLQNAVQKHRSRAVLHLLARHLGHVGLTPDLLKTDFTRGLPLLEASYTMDDGSRLGWQLQGDQWRRFLVVPQSLAGTGPKAGERRAAFALTAHGSWFDFAAEQALGPFQPALTSALKHYAPDFVYDYVKVAELDLATLYRLASTTLADALDHRNGSGQAAG